MIKRKFLGWPTVINPVYNLKTINCYIILTIISITMIEQSYNKKLNAFM